VSRRRRSAEKEYLPDWLATRDGWVSAVDGPAAEVFPVMTPSVNSKPATSGRVQGVQRPYFGDINIKKLPISYDSLVDNSPYVSGGSIPADKRRLNNKPSFIRVGKSIPVEEQDDNSPFSVDPNDEEYIDDMMPVKRTGSYFRIGRSFDPIVSKDKLETGFETIIDYDGSDVQEEKRERGRSFVRVGRDPQLSPMDVETDVDYDWSDVAEKRKRGRSFVRVGRDQWQLSTPRYFETEVDYDGSGGADKKQRGRSFVRVGRYPQLSPNVIETNVNYDGSGVAEKWTNERSCVCLGRDPQLLPKNVETNVNYDRPDSAGKQQKGRTFDVAGKQQKGRSFVHVGRDQQLSTTKVETGADYVDGLGVAEKRKKERPCVCVCHDPQVLPKNVETNGKYDRPDVAGKDQKGRTFDLAGKQQKGRSFVRVGRDPRLSAKDVETNVNYDTSDVAEKRQKGRSFVRVGRAPLPSTKNVETREQQSTSERPYVGVIMQSALMRIGKEYDEEEGDNKLTAVVSVVDDKTNLPALRMGNMDKSSTAASSTTA